MKQKQIDCVSCRYFKWRLFRRDGVYYGDGRGSKHRLGKHSLGTRDYDEALRQLNSLDEHKAIELGMATANSMASPEEIMIPDGWQQYFEFCDRSAVMGGVSAATRKRYRAVRDKHTTFCSKRQIATWQDFTSQRLEDYGNWLAKSKADRTVYLELTLLKSVNAWLIEKKLLGTESKIALSLQKPQGTDTYCYSRAEVSAMAKHCREKANLQWLADVIQGLALTGMRIGELAGLRHSDIDLTPGRETIRIADERSSRRKREAGTARTTKGRRSRTIPVHSELRDVIAKLPRKADGLVFHGSMGGRLRPRNVLEQFIRHVITPLSKEYSTPEGEIGFRDGRLHSLRHFFCSQCFLGGASEGEIREWLGHADSKMVEHYRHLRSEDAQRKMNQIRFLDRSDESRPNVSSLETASNAASSGTRED